MAVGVTEACFLHMFSTFRSVPSGQQCCRAKAHVDTAGSHRPSPSRTIVCIQKMSALFSHPVLGQPSFSLFSLLPGSGQHPHPREPGPSVPRGTAERTAGETGSGERHAVQWGPHPSCPHAAQGDQCPSAEASTATATTAPITEQDCAQRGADSRI